MEFMRWEWLKILHGQFNRLSSCCKKTKPDPDDGSEEAEERVPFMSRHNSSRSKDGGKQQHAAKVLDKYN